MVFLTPCIQTINLAIFHWSTLWFIGYSTYSPLGIFFCTTSLPRRVPGPCARRRASAQRRGMGVAPTAPRIGPCWCSSWRNVLDVDRARHHPQFTDVYIIYDKLITLLHPPTPPHQYKQNEVWAPLSTQHIYIYIVYCIYIYIYVVKLCKIYSI